MTRSNNLTETTRVLCRGLVAQHIPGETQMFDPIWEAFWQTLPGDRIEMLKKPPAWGGGGQSATALAALGDTSQQAMDALFVIGSVVGAVITLLNHDQGTLIETADIDHALRHHAGQLGAPEHIRRILETFGSPLLAEQLAAIDWGSGEAARPQATGLLKVEYSEPTWDGRSSTGAVMKTQTNEEIEELFRTRMVEFDLFVDEPEWVVYARGTKVGLAELQPRERRLLFLVLKALRRIGVVTHADIRNNVLQNPEASSASVRGAKSSLNGKLFGMLEELMKAAKTEGRYVVTRRPYCWVRLDGVPSKLAPDLPV